jgi:hypothetical protein
VLAGLLGGGDAFRAALLNHLLYWIARRAKGQEPDKIKSGEVYWYGSAEDINVSRLWVKNVLRAYGEREET